MFNGIETFRSPVLADCKVQGSLQCRGGAAWGILHEWCMRVIA
jgi:hypothetical protein